MARVPTSIINHSNEIAIIDCYGNCLELNSDGSIKNRSNNLAVVQNIIVGPLIPILLSGNNNGRIKIIIHNDSGGILFVKLGPDVSSFSYTYRLTPQTFIEITNYTGIITALKNSGTTSVLITEF